jgi:hexulose-6-phosphate isomerase
MEWTVDQDRLTDNPIMCEDGQEEIRVLMRECKLNIPSLTGDCFMQAPFWKATGRRRDGLLRDFEAIIDSCCALELNFVVVPLVDNGRLETCVQQDSLIRILNEMTSSLILRGIKIAFESDYKPLELKRLIDCLDPTVFGINYDTGNSAALGYNAEEEINTYGDRIFNVHLKDRIFGGTTVPLGAGNADFDKIFAGLGFIGYRGNYIMQTARACDGQHEAVLQKYNKMALEWIERYDA